MNEQPNTLDLVGYASGNLGKSVLWSTSELFFLFILTELWGLSPASAGAVIFISMVWDAISDPLVGICVGETRTRFGRYFPFLLIGSPLCALTFILFFSINADGGSNAFVTALFLCLLFRSFYTVCDVPHNALMSSFAPNRRLASLVSSWRFFFSTVGMLYVSYFVSPTIPRSSTGDQQDLLTVSVLAAGGLFCVTLLWAAFVGRAYDRVSTIKSKNVYTFSSYLGAIWHKSFRFLLLLVSLQAAFFPLFSKGLVYFAKYGPATSVSLQLMLTILTVFQGAALPVWFLLSKRFSRIMAIRISYTVFIFGVGAFALSVYAGGYGLLLVALAIIGASIAGSNMLIWAALPDQINELKAYGVENFESHQTAVFLLVLKASIGLGALGLGFALSAIGLDETDRPYQETPLLLAIICGLPGIGAFLALAWSFHAPMSMRRVGPA